MKLIAATLLALTVLASPAAAHGRHHHHYRHHYAQTHREGHREAFRDWGYERRSQARRPAHGARYASAGMILPHPGGCPRTAFCGCGAAVELFGRPIRELWLAANWFGFPRAAPAPGMAAVRRHHVMVIREYLGGDRAVVFDANSGRHQTRIHEVSLRGYVIVNPRGGRRYAGI